MVLGGDDRELSLRGSIAFHVDATGHGIDIHERAARTAADVLRELEAEARAQAARKTPADPNLGRCLLAEGPVTHEFLRQQIAVSGKTDSYIGHLLSGLRAAREAELFEFLAASYQVPHVDLKQCRVPVPVARSIPRETALKYRTVPFARIGDLLCIVFGGEPNAKAIEAVRRSTGLRVKAFRCPPHHIEILLRRLFRRPGTRQVVGAVPISQEEYDEAVGGPEARWESIHATAGPVRARRLVRG